MKATFASAVAVALLASASSAGAVETVIDLSGQVPDGPERHFSVPFDVPEGTKEIAVHQLTLSDKNILDFGIMDPNGVWRGWGGSRIQDAVVGEQAATRSHVPGPIAAGKWEIVVGEAAVNETPALFTLEVTLRDTPTLPPQTDRKPYVPTAPLEVGERWYAGDFHVHSIESNDAKPPLDQIATYAESRGLDFVHISDHNIHTALDYMTDAQKAHPKLLFVPGAEYTTYWGHASAVGATQWVDDRTELPGHSIEQAVAAYHAQGAFFSLNHPALALGDACIGCAWEHDLPIDQVDGIEIGTGKFGIINTDAIKLWDEYCDTGRHVVPLGGSDDHSGGADVSTFKAPIGSPTTMVWAKELSVAGILEALKNGRTVVKLKGPDDPMIELETLSGSDENHPLLHATITGGAGLVARVVKNGEYEPEVDIDADPFVIEEQIAAPDSGEDRYRVEVLEAGRPLTVTSHVWIERTPQTPVTPVEETDDGGCGCSVPSRSGNTAALLASALLGLALLGRRR